MRLKCPKCRETFLVNIKGIWGHYMDHVNLCEGSEPLLHTTEPKRVDKLNLDELMLRSVLEGGGFNAMQVDALISAFKSRPAR